MQTKTQTTQSALQAALADAARLGEPVIRLYISQNFPAARQRMGNGRLAKAISASEMTILQKYRTDGEMLTLLAMVPPTSSASIITTFNVSETLKNAGYSSEFVANIQDGEDLGSTLNEGLDKSNFPLKNKDGYMRFSTSATSFYMPVQGMLLNTNYFRDARYERKQFNQQIAEACKLFATYFSMTNGVVSYIDAAEAGRVMLNFENIMSPAISNSRGFLCTQLEDWIRGVSCPSLRGWNQVTAHAGDFAHNLYVGIISALANDPHVIGLVVNMVNMIIRPTIKSGREVPYMKFENGALQINPPPMSLPRVVGGKLTDLSKKSATLEQALFALQLSRTFRGENKAKKGALSRQSYVAIGLHSEMAESIYMASNLRRVFRQTEEVVVVADSAKSTNMLIHILEAATIVDYRGVIMLPNVPGIRNLLKSVEHDKFKDTAYFYGSAQFVVFLGDTDRYLVPGSYLKRDGYYFPSVECVVLDMRPNRVEYDRTKPEKYSNAQGDVLLTRLAEWTFWNRKVVARCGLFNGMFDGKFKDLQFTTGVEIHNLVAWIGFKCDILPQASDWWYDVNTVDVLKEVSAASILVNIIRCTQSINHVRIQSALQQFNYKCPRVMISGIGKLNVNIVAYTDVKIQNAISQGHLAVTKMFNEATNTDRALMLANADVAAMLIQADTIDKGKEIVVEGEGSSTGVVPEGKDTDGFTVFTDAPDTSAQYD